MAVVCIQNKNFKKAKQYFDQLSPNDFESRIYLYHGALSDYYLGINNIEKAIVHLDFALSLVNNSLEKEHLLMKKRNLVSRQ
jgi:RNA polymerase sigma-70 factor (ECF subfamily)